jgi:hypothetical protein
MSPPPNVSPESARTRRPPWVSTTAVVSILLISCLLATLLLYVIPLVTALAQGVPDPEFRTSVTYTPQQGPPSPVLLDSRPERIVQRYLADYVSLAGTYPCAQDVSQYDILHDPVLNGQPCPVSRPIASYSVTSVTIQTQGFTNGSVASVRYLVTYADGSQRAYGMVLAPDRSQVLWPLETHLDCWSSLTTLEVFGDLVPDIPPGAAYSSRDGLTTYCKDHAGHIIQLGDRNGYATPMGLSRQDAVVTRAGGPRD